MLHVVVVGGGPAGLIAAETLAKAGIKTTLIEQAPDRVLPCAGLVTGRVLSEFAVPEQLLAQRIAEVGIVSPSNRTAFLSLAGAEVVGTITRDLLQALLRRRAQEAGVRMIHGRFQRFRHAEGDYPLLEIQRAESDEREELACDVVIAADGVHSRVARALRLPAHELGVAYMEKLTPPADARRGAEAAQVHFGRKVSADAYGWLVPYQDHWQIGVTTQARYGKRVWDMLAELKKRLGGTLEGAKPIGREAFCYPLRPRKTLAFERVLLVGDAAGLGAAATRDGLYYACKSGLMAAQTVIRHQNVPLPDRLFEYNRDFWAEFGAFFDSLTRLEADYFQQDRRREVLVDLGWNREIAKFAVESFVEKRRFAPPLPLALTIKAKLVGQLVKSSLNQRKRPEPEFHSRILPAGENYLDLALKSPTGPLRPLLESTVPKAEPVAPAAPGETP